jgi:hypothetical protein
MTVGVAKANEVLLWGKKKDAQELLECGFVKYHRFRRRWQLVDRKSVAKYSRLNQQKNFIAMYADTCSMS